MATWGYFGGDAWAEWRIDFKEQKRGERGETAASGAPASPRTPIGMLRGPGHTRRSAAGYVSTLIEGGG